MMNTTATSPAGRAGFASTFLARPNSSMSLRLAKPRCRNWSSLLIIPLILTALCAVSAGPVVAALTPILNSPDIYDEPNLTGTNPFPGNLNPSVLETLYGESNLRRIDDASDRFFAHTGSGVTIVAVAHFTGGHQDIGFYPHGTGSFLTLAHVSGTGYSPVMTVDSGFEEVPVDSVTIEPSESGPLFTLGMCLPGTRLYSSDPLQNPVQVGLDHMVSFRIVDNVGHPTNAVENLVVAWEMGLGGGDRDYQDIVLEIGGLTVVPEPASWILAILAGCCGVAIRHWGCRRSGPASR